MTMSDLRGGRRPAAAASKSGLDAVIHYPLSLSLLPLSLPTGPDPPATQAKGQMNTTHD